MEDPNRSAQYMEELEALAQNILEDRQEIVALDKRRQQNREALSALSKSKESKTWFALGPCMIKVDGSKAKTLLSNDQVEINTQINTLRSDLKVKVNKLRDMEYQPPVPGLMLNTMTRAEMQAVGQVLGRHAD